MAGEAQARRGRGDRGAGLTVAMRLRTVTVAGFNGSKASFRVRPLAIEELHPVLLTARQEGWIGNAEIIDLVLRAGLDHDSLAFERADDDIFLRRNVAKEIWLLTLRSISSQARRIAAIAGVAVKIWPMRRYTFADLATPSMLFLIADDASRYDVEAIAKLYLDKSVESTSIDRETLFHEHFEWLLATLLKTYGAGDVFDRLPSSFLPTAAHRFYAAMKLTATLDWWQYRLAIDSFNFAVRALAWRSNQLGGVAVEQEDVKLDAGLAMFLDLVGPERSVPIQLVGQLFVDAVGDRLDAFAPSHRKLLRAEAREADQRIRDAWRVAPAASEEERKHVAAEEIFGFELAIRRSQKLLDEVCFVYAEQFSEFAKERLQDSVARAVAAIRAIPTDTYVLVEGPSDVTYLEKTLEQGNAQSGRIRCIDCGGDSKVLARARSLLQEQPGASIITVFDSDAADLHREAELLFRERSLCRSFCYAAGAVEEQIPPELHLLAVRTEYGLDVSDAIDHGKPLLPQIKKHLWQSKKVAFDKVPHANAVAKHMTAEAPRSETLSEIASTAVDFARQKQKTRAASAPALDRLLEQARLTT